MPNKLYANILIWEQGDLTYIRKSEYCSHAELAKYVTGLDPRNKEEEAEAWQKFYQLTDYDLLWVSNDGPEWKGRVTSMGHALFQEDGSDYNPDVYCPFKDAQEVLSFEPLVSLEKIVKKYGKTKVIIGNINTRILTFGTREQIFREVRRCANIGRNCPGYFFAVGNHIPHNVPLENALYYLELIKKLGQR